MTVASESASGADYIRQGFRALLDLDDANADLLEALITEAWSRTALTISTDSGNLLSAGTDGKPLITSVDSTKLANMNTGTMGLLYQTAIIAALGVAASQFGTAAFVDAIPSGAPTTATQVAGAITLDFAGKSVLQTTTTAAITTITLSNITAYSEVTWIVRHTTSRDVTWPAGTRIVGGALTVTGTADSTRRYKIYNNNGTYEVEIGDAMPVGA
jgi:hypothetical protein